jgi:hypothetical protein
MKNQADKFAFAHRDANADPEDILARKRVKREHQRLGAVFWTELARSLQSPSSDQRISAYHTIVAADTGLHQASDEGLKELVSALLEQSEPAEFKGSFCQIESLLFLEREAASALRSEIEQRLDLADTLKFQMQGLKGRGEWLDWESSADETQRDLYMFIRGCWEGPQ